MLFSKISLKGFLILKGSIFFRRSVLIQRTISAFSSGLQSPKDNVDSGVIEKSLEMFAKPEAPAPRPVIEKQAGVDSGTNMKQASKDSGTTAKQASVDLGTTMKEVSINSGKTAKQVSVDSGMAGNEPSSDAVTSGKRFSFKTLAHAVVRQMSISEIEKEQKELCPKVEGRIFHFDDEVCMFVHQILLLLSPSLRKYILLKNYLT